MLFHICFMENQIFLKDVLEQIDSTYPNGEPMRFDVEVFTFNRNNKEGGKLNFYRDAKKLVSTSPGRKLTLEEKAMQKNKFRKSPNHYENRTRNIETTEGRKIKINILFIRMFNGQKVIY